MDTNRGSSAQADQGMVDRYNEGAALWDADRIPEAIEAFRDAARGGDEEATYALGRALLWNGEVEESVPLLSRVLAALFADRGEFSASRRWLRAAAKGGDQWAVDRLAGC